MLTLFSLLSCLVLLFCLRITVRVWRHEAKKHLILLLGLFFAGIIILTGMGMFYHPRNGGVQILLAGSTSLTNMLATLYGVLLVITGYQRVRKVRVAAPYYIVLGAYLSQGRSVGPLLAGRITKAMQATRKQPNQPIVIFCGGQGPDEVRTEAAAMAAYAQAHDDYPLNQLWQEGTSRNTDENLANSWQIIKAVDPTWSGKCAIFTSDYHYLRTVILTRQNGLQAQVVVSTTKHLRSFWVGITREFIALLNLYRWAFFVLVALTYLITSIILK